MSSAFKKIVSLGAPVVFLSPFAMGASVSLNANLESFFSMATPSLLPDVTVDGSTHSFEFRFFESVMPSGDNASTHILIDGLVPVSDGSDVLYSNYRGIDISTGNVYDMGSVYLELPSAPSGDGASSPIVGIVARDTPASGSSGWSEYTTSSAAGALDGASGTISFDDADDSSTMDFDFDVGGSNFLGSASYVLTDATTIDVGGFDLSDGTTTYSVSPFQLVLVDGEWYSFLLTDAADYDSLMYELRVTTGTDIPTWGSFIYLGESASSRAWYSWNFKWVYEGIAGNGSFSGEFGIYWLQDLNRWVYIDPNSGTGSIAGFWMYVFDMPGVGGGSWCYLGTAFGATASGRLPDLQASGGLADVEFRTYCAANGAYYFFTEYEDTGEYNNAPETAGNYFAWDLGAGVQYLKVQEPIDDLTGVEIPDGQLPADD